MLWYYRGQAIAKKTDKPKLGVLMNVKYLPLLINRHKLQHSIYKSNIIDVKTYELLARKVNLRTHLDEQCEGEKDDSELIQ